MKLSTPRLLLVAAALAGASAAHAQEKFVYLTNWFAEAEHGGFYQALASGLYKKGGLDVFGGSKIRGAVRVQGVE